MTSPPPPPSPNPDPEGAPEPASTASPRPVASTTGAEPPPGYLVLRTDPIVLPLPLRLVLAGVFLWAGVLKFTDPMGAGIARFEALGFPFPGFFAPLVGGFEVVCALLLAVGLGVRVAVLPLATILLAAMSIHLVQGTSTAPGGILFEGVLLVMAVVLGWTGGGRASLDHSIWRGVVEGGEAVPPSPSAPR